MEHKELVGNGCYHVRNTDDGAPSVRSAYEGNAETINNGFAFHLNAKVNNCPSYLVPRLACRQVSAEKMADQGGGKIHGEPCVFTCLHSLSIVSVLPSHAERMGGDPLSVSQT